MKCSTSARLDDELLNWVGIGHNRNATHIDWGIDILSLNLIWGFFDPSICWAQGLVIARENEEEKDKQVTRLGRVLEKNISE